MADRYWVGGTGNWDAATTTHWSASSGGGGGSSVPTSADNVIFDSLSNATAYTVTITATANCLNLTMNGPLVGAVTWAGSSAMNIFGNINLAGGTAGITNTYTGTITFSATSGTKTITTNSIALLGSTTFNGAGGTFQLADNLTTGGASNVGSIIFTNGTFDATTNSTTVTMKGSTPVLTCTFSPTFYNLSIIPVSPSAVDVVTLSNNITVTNTFTVTGGSTSLRAYVKSNTTGVPRTITAAAIAVSYADFQDITGSGAATWDMSAATGGSGDCGGNTMKALGSAAFTSATTQHWINASSGSWSNAVNWTSRIPLPQDTVVMDMAFGTSQTVTADMRFLGKDIDWTGATWTTGLTWATTTTSSICGSLTLISGLTLSGTNTYTLEGRGSHTITGNSATVTNSITLNAPGATYTMGSDLTLGTTRTTTITLGTFDTSSYVISTGLLSLGSGANGYIAKLKLNAATHLLTGTGTILSAAQVGATSVLDAGTSTLKITDTTNTAITFTNAKTLYNVWFDRGASTATITINNGGIFHDFKDTGTVAHTISCTSSTPNAVTTFTVSGSSGQLITLAGSSSGNPCLWLCTSGTINCDYITVRDTLVGGGAIWNAGVNSTFSTGNFFGNGFGWSDATSTVSNRYWVTGGTGNWSSTTNWSTSSGGASGATVPVGEKVNFDANSGAGTVTIDTSPNCGDFISTNFTGTIAGTPTFINVRGDFKLGNSTTLSATLPINFRQSGNAIKDIDFNGKFFTGNIDINGTASSTVLDNAGYFSSWRLVNNLISNTGKTLTLSGGNLDFNGYNVTAAAFTSNNTSKRTLDLGSGTFEITGSGSCFSCTASIMFTVIPGTSTIKFTDNTGTNKTISPGGKTYYNIWMTGSGTGSYLLSDSVTFNEIKNDNPLSSIGFGTGAITTFNSIIASGSPGKRLGLTNTSNSKAFLRPTSGSFSLDYVNITNISVIGTGYVGVNSIDAVNSNLSNIIFAAPSTVVAGTVTNGGTPVSGAIVRLVRQEDNMEVGTTTTDGSGDYSFYADSSKLYHVFVEYTDGGTKYNAKSLWNITPV